MKRKYQIWVAPPNWPPAPDGWRPGAGWMPDPSWPPAPNDWEFWQVATEGGKQASDGSGSTEESDEIEGVGATPKTFHGWDGDVTIDGWALLIRRSVIGRMQHKGSAIRRIPFDALSSVTFIPVTRVHRGVIALGLGGRPAAAHWTRALGHVDAISFRRRHQKNFELLYQNIAEIVASNVGNGVEFRSVMFDFAHPKRERRRAEKRQRLQAQIASYGRLVADEIFGWRTVRIYEKGYVRVSVPLFGSKASFERLVSIVATSNVSKKSAAGRTAGAVVTSGWNVVLSPDKRGDVYLTISTDAKTRVLHDEPPTASNMKAAHKLEAAGQGVIGRRSAEGMAARIPRVNAQPQTIEMSTLDRLNRLSDLFARGLITEEEHGRQRDRVLNEM